MTSRSTRSRKLSSKLSSGDFVVEIPKISSKSSKLRNPTTKLHSTKGSNNKLSNVDVFLSLRSPVLRDRTNLTKEPTTKLDVLKKGLETKDAANVKVMTEERTRRTKVTKPTISQDTENIRVTETESKKNIQALKKGVKVSKMKKPMIPSTSNNKSVETSTENGQVIANTKRVMRKLIRSGNSEEKLPVLETRRTRKTVVKEQLETVKKTRARKESVSDDEPESPSIKLSKNKSKVSTRKTIANQSVKRTTRLSANKVVNKSPKANTSKKFFKSKLRTPATISAHSKITPMKKRIVGKAQQAAANRKNANKIALSRQSTSFRMRQPTLQESFAKQPKKILRPRKTSKNYCEESRLAADESENKNKLDNVDVKKGPVYKLMNDSGENNTDKDKVYEFVFDGNDSKERATKKRKKRIVRKAPAKRAKIVTKELKPSSSNELPTKVIDKLPTTVQETMVKKISDNNPVKNDNKLTTVMAEIHLPPSEISHNVTELLPQSPRMNSVDELKGERRISLTVTPLQPRSINDDSLPLNKPNKFNLRPSTQFKTMMDASLLRRSLSPIPNEIPKENIETENPWRAPSLNTFSRVKNVFQSTPQGKKFGTLLGKAALLNEPSPKPQRLRMNKIVEQNDENANISLKKKSPEKIQSMNTSKSPRKFGTVISNINNNSPIKRQSVQINTSKSPRKFGTVISNINESLQNTSAITIERTRLTTNVEQSTVNNTFVTSLPNYDEITSLDDESFHDKENSAPNNESPKKLLAERIDSPHITPIHPKNNQNSTETKCDEVSEPQPGPSGLQKSNSLSETWKLKQSNLNKFLNLPDMPSSTRISTAHGIFDEIHSTPIVGKPVKRKPIESLDVKNAFGFDDDDDIDDIDVSPINRCSPVRQTLAENKLRKEDIPTLKKSNDKAVVDVVQQPARLFIDEVKKKLIPSKVVNNKKIDKENRNENVPVTNENFSNTTKKHAMNAIEFSDTFDNLIDEVDEENVKEIPLFVDVEPVHFTQPPRYSYTHKRKRNVSWNTSEETEEDESEEIHHKRTKKKRIGKAEREEKKILDDWAKSMNNTFEEIDHFDLVVE